MRESRTYGPVRGRSQMSVPMANNTQWTRSSDLLAFVPPHVPFAQKKKRKDCIILLSGSAAWPPARNFPRLRALALFGRLSAARA